MKDGGQEAKPKKNQIQIGTPKILNMLKYVEIMFNTWANISLFLDLCCSIMLFIPTLPKIATFIIAVFRPRGPFSWQGGLQGPKNHWVLVGFWLGALESFDWLDCMILDDLVRWSMWRRVFNDSTMGVSVGCTFYAYKLPERAAETWLNETAPMTFASTWMPERTKRHINHIYQRTF